MQGGAGSTAFNVQPRIFFAAAFATILAACGGAGGTSETLAAPAAAASIAAPAAPSQTATPQPAAPEPAVALPTPTAMGLAAVAPAVANTTLAGNQGVQNVSALAGGGYAVAWSTDGELAVQRFDANGAKSGAETKSSGAAITALRDGSVVVAALDSRGIVLQHAGSETVVAGGANPVLIALDDGGFALGWSQAGALSVQRFTARMQANGAPTVFPAASADENVSLKLVAAPGGRVIAGTTHRFQGIPYVRFRIGTRDVGALFDANTGLPEFNTTLAPLADGRFILWSMGSNGGYRQVLDASGNAIGGPVAVAVVPEVGVALEDGGWATVVRQMFGQSNVAQRYDANGATVGAAIEVAGGMSRPLPVASIGSGFALAWNFTGAQGDADIRTQRIDAR